MRKIVVCTIITWILFAAGCSRSNNPETVINEKAEQLEEMLQVKTLPNKTVFFDFITGQRLEGFEVLAQGCASDLPVKVSTFSSFCGAWFGQLSRSGWKEDQRYNADSPAGSVRADTKDTLLLVTSARWVTAPDCQQQEPFDPSSVPLEKQLYTISVIVAALPQK